MFGAIAMKMTCFYKKIRWIEILNMTVKEKPDAKTGLFHHKIYEFWPAVPFMTQRGLNKSLQYMIINIYCISE